MSEFVIFTDFDGTITLDDTIDKLLSIFADEEWLLIQKQWEKGEIGTKDCIAGQLEYINNLNPETLNQFLNEIKIDENFISFLDFVKENSLDLYIVSDGFDVFINAILNRYGINNLKIFSNTCELSKGKLRPIFPTTHKNCSSGSGVCKCSILKKISQGKNIIYIGDGRSDICAAKHADVLFAKKALARYCQQENMKYIPFETFQDIQDKLKEIIG